MILASSRIFSGFWWITIATSWSCRKTTAEDALALKPDGVFLSNGPGDPEPATYAIETIRAMLGRVPVFGICLGHNCAGSRSAGKPSN